MEFWNILTANVSEYSNSNCFAFWNILTASWLLYIYINNLFTSDHELMRQFLYCFTPVPTHSPDMTARWPWNVTEVVAGMSHPGHN